MTNIMQPGEVEFRKYLKRLLPQQEGESSGMWRKRLAQRTGLEESKVYSLYYDPRADINAAEWEAIKKLEPRKEVKPQVVLALTEKLISQAREMEDVYNRLRDELGDQTDTLTHQLSPPRRDLPSSRNAWVSNRT